MAPHGAAEPFLGTNAVAVAVPMGRHGTFCLDTSASTVARGRILRAAALGEAIEPGWAVDADGRATTDAAAALAGAVLPLGGAKGSGLAFAICLLAGTLGGAPFDPDVVPTVGPHAGDRQDLGQLFVVLDPWRLASREEATARVEQLVDRLQGLRPAEGVDVVRFAGERGDGLARHRTVHGIPVEDAELGALAEACAACGLPEVAERARGLGG
jgi:LDH2 family malate/lactate/ureidoglycolate dehydrogenase